MAETEAIFSDDPDLNDEIENELREKLILAQKLKIKNRRLPVDPPEEIVNPMEEKKEDHRVPEIGTSFVLKDENDQEKEVQVS